METDEKLINQPSSAKAPNVWAEESAGEPIEELLPRASSSALSLKAVNLPANTSLTIGAEGQDSVLVLLEGVMDIRVAGQERSQSAGDATLLTDGTEAVLRTGPAAATAVQFVVEVGLADSHAPLGAGEIFSSVDLTDPQSATSNRSYRIIFGPENGSSHATLFVGLVPVGAAPWHFHQYEEIALILKGQGLFHHDGTATPLLAGSAFHIPARDLHINENTSSSEEVLLLGFLTPAGSPSAAYLPKPVD
ncbi:cupin domain-containing protein [Arthrobacter sp. HMWF013]|uniref:cupin domain-containing protein n=1 Tax=Arthrobacter sp. HMWF013 TaxID=2056849 RepID=UPI0015E7EAA1|nr:cupin domain-containing protein [Arthrobacter sp. HMWF013]